MALVVNGVGHLQPLADEVEVSLWSCTALLRLLLEGVQHVDLISDLHRVDRSVGIVRVILYNLQDTRSTKPFERLRVGMLAAFLREA